MHVVALAAGPAHALYFASYERMKIVLSETSEVGHSPVANAAAGCLATLLHDALMVPADGKYLVIRRFVMIFMITKSSYQAAFTSLCIAIFWCSRLLT